MTTQRDPWEIKRLLPTLAENPDYYLTPSQQTLRINHIWIDLGPLILSGSIDMNELTSFLQMKGMDYKDPVVILAGILETLYQKDLLSAQDIRLGSIDLEKAKSLQTWTVGFRQKFKFPFRIYKEIPYYNRSGEFVACRGRLDFLHVYIIHNRGLEIQLIPALKGMEESVREMGNLYRKRVIETIQGMVAGGRNILLIGFDVAVQDVDKSLVKFERISQEVLATWLKIRAS